MGTSSSYSGSGGKAGKAIREEIAEWLDNLQPRVDDAPQEPAQDDEGSAETDEAVLPLVAPFQNVIALLRPRRPSGGGDGLGGGGGGGAQSQPATGSRGGPQRSAARSASTAGRAAAAAYAFRTGDAGTLARLGLNYAELVALGSPILVTRRIVEMVCGPRGDSTIDDSEQRLIAAEVAEWVGNQQAEGYEATPEDIAKHAIANVVVDTLLTEAGEIISNQENAVLAEDDIRDAAEAWVENHASVEIQGATEEDFSRAIETGIDSLRTIIRGGA